jgi:hypothetical protein
METQPGDAYTVCAVGRADGLMLRRFKKSKLASNILKRISHFWDFEFEYL